MARLIPIEYELDEHELPDHLYVTGSLDIELDCVDGSPYIWRMDVRVYNAETEITVEHFFRHGQPDNWHPSIELKNDLHRDKKLMDRIWDECAHQGGWD
jgi:hypothetical protein